MGVVLAAVVVLVVVTVVLIVVVAVVVMVVVEDDVVAGLGVVVAELIRSNAFFKSGRYLNSLVNCCLPRNHCCNLTWGVEEIFSLCMVISCVLHTALSFHI